MLLFHNPGLLPLEAIRLMGASVKTAGSFGRFGTGLKYAIATILRGGGSIHIWLGPSELTFSVNRIQLKEHDFDEVLLVTAPGTVDEYRAELGFTTQLGKDWEPWMALRELACNARDEGGDFKLIDAPEVPPCFSARDGETVIVVDWAEMDVAARENAAGVFAPVEEPLTQLHGVRVLSGPSDYLYHRGVRVWALPKPSVFTYDIVGPLDLTEDRTVKYSFVAVATVRNAFLKMTTEDERPLVRAAVTAKKGETWEGGFDWAGGEWDPTQPLQLWLEVVAEARNAGNWAVSDSARDVLLKHQAFHRAQASQWYDTEGANERLSDAAEALEELGFELQKVNVFITDALPGAALSAVNNGSIFITQELLDARVVVIVRELIRRLLELEGAGDHDRLLAVATQRLFDVCLGSHFRFKRELDLFKEEARAGSVADVLLVAMDVRGEEYPARPSELDPDADIPAY